VVFVLEAARRPLAPCRPARARRLLARQQAAVWRAQPFTLILTRAVISQDTGQDTVTVEVVSPATLLASEALRVEAPIIPPSSAASAAVAIPSPTITAMPKSPPVYHLKIDPGSKTTGLALVHDHDATGRVFWAAELSHRGDQVKEQVAQRRACRRSRRACHTRYRPTRYLNRRRRDGWLPPSLESRVQNILIWVERLRRWCPIDAISLELVIFDTQLLQPPEISGVEYQQGTLAGYEVREYLLEKWGRRCAYCRRTNVPLEIEHLNPKSRQGSDAIWNLTIACTSCTQRKGNRMTAEFGFPELEAAGKRPLRDAAAVNATRWALFRRLLPKTRWLDAVCVGASTPETLRVAGMRPLLIRAIGWHSRQMCQTNAVGFPNQAPKATSAVGGLRTGALVRAVVPPPERQGRDVRRADRGAGHRFVQRHHGGRVDPGYLRELLYAPPVRRWLHVPLPARRSGASSPGLKAGVSAPLF
jgi:5-methylcytosine-specific restriction endonuclease McrA